MGNGKRLEKSVALAAQLQIKIKQKLEANHRNSLNQQRRTLSQMVNQTKTSKPSQSLSVSQNKQSTQQYR